MHNIKQRAILFSGLAVAVAAMLPMVASAHTRVFLGINLGGLFAPPPVVVYAPRPRYYVPPPPVYYTPAPAYFAPPVVYEVPHPVYYHHWDHDWDHHWRGDGDWRGGRDRGWHRGWHHHDGDDGD